MLRSFVLIALGLAATLVVVASAESVDTVRLIKHPSVTVIGDLVIERSLGRQISRFRGVPYAQPPVGGLRFHRPVSWTPTSGASVEATAWPSQCTQMQFGPEDPSPEPYLVEHSPNKSEDCLYLNIWSPELKENVEERSAALRPVVVWIHGGGLYFGSSSFELYNLETFASRADVVAVSLNYRLATLGFFYSDAVPEVSGNQGLWDQAMALQFVQENIAAFGGDPSRVTIIGESAGSWSVSAHIVSPISRDLFSQAILMSGAVLNVEEPDKYVTAALTGIRKTGCANEEETQISKSVVECLQKLDPFVVDSILFGVFGMSTKILVKDGNFFPDTPRNLLSSGNHKKTFNLLLSTAEDEAPFVFFNFPNDTRFLDNPTPITLEESKAVLVSLFKDKEGFNEAVTTKVYYSGQNGAIVNADAYRQAVSIAYGHYIISCPTWNFAKRLYASDQTSSVYQWYYTAKEGNYAKWMCKSWEKACHTDDLFPAFGVPFRFPEKFTNRERDVSNEVIDFLKHFVYTGKPGPNQKEWEPYFMAPAGSKNGGNVVVAPYYEISNSIRSPESFKFNLKQLECETVWGQMPGL